MSEIWSWCDWQLERESGTASGAIAMSGKLAVHCLGRVGAAVETESMAILFCGEAVRENTGKILRRDADAIVAYGDVQAVIRVRQSAEWHPNGRTSVYIDPATSQVDG